MHLTPPKNSSRKKQEYSSYSELFYPVYFWRTASGVEVNFILGDHEIPLK